MINKISSDVTLIGAGLVGMSAALALANEGLSVVVIESAGVPEMLKKESDGRTCAVSYGSAQIFKEIGLWDALEKHAGPILDIRVTDENSPFFLHYDHKLVGDAPMGYIIENYYIRKVFFKAAKKYKDLKIISPARYKSIIRDQCKAVVALENGQVIESDLIIAADGKNSQLRKLAGIKSTHWSYKQCGIVCTIKHEKNHNGLAVENFLPAGPFAILPMHGGYHSSLVWTESEDLTPLFMDMNDEEFLEQIQLRFGDYLGKLELASGRFSYPLGLQNARKYVDTRLVLIGDAAHAMHPIAGQGFNLGIRDVKPLKDLVAKARAIGGDIGGAGVLEEYENSRKFDATSFLTLTDVLNRLFCSEISQVKMARKIGLAAVNKLPVLKKFLQKGAMGV